MIVFWLICAAFILLALAFVLPPALDRSDDTEDKDQDQRKRANIAVYRDQLSELESDLKNGIVSQEQYAQDREEIERRLLEDTAGSRSIEKAPAVSAKGSLYVLGLTLPIVAIVFYLIVGTPESITGEGTPVATAPSASGERTQEQIAANVEALAQRLKENPSDAAGWAMLARSYSNMERFGESAGAYAKATELKPNDADLWAEYAFVSAMASGRSLQGKPEELIAQALKVDPENARALQLAGSAAFQAKDYKKAVNYWERVLKRVPPDSEVGQLMTERLNEARTLAASQR